MARHRPFAIAVATGRCICPSEAFSTRRFPSQRTVQNKGFPELHQTPCSALTEKREVLLVNTKMEKRQRKQRNKLERYFGIHVQILDEIDPMIITAIKHRAEKIFNRVNFHPNEYFLYVHCLKVTPICETRHYWGASTPVEERVHRFSVSFHVNPKQRSTSIRDGLIKFYDAYVLDGYSSKEDDIPITDVTDVGWSYPGIHLSGGTVFKTHLVTYVSNELVRDSHKKIKIEIGAIPTDEFSTRLNTGEYTKTSKFDVFLSQDVNLILKALSPEEEARIAKAVADAERRQGELENLRNIHKHMNKNQNTQPTVVFNAPVGTANIISGASDFTLNQKVDGMPLSDIYQKMLKSLEDKQAEVPNKKEVAQAIATMAKSEDRKQLGESFRGFMNTAKNACDVFKEFIPLLTQLLG